MLHRAHPDGIVAIAQPAHGRIVGMIARAWGGGGFAVPPHWDEVCVAADTHELGMAAWETAPTLNTATGLPHAYYELPRSVHLAQWQEAGPLALMQGRYIALMVSRHGTWIFHRYETDPAAPHDRAATATYLWSARQFQHRVRASLAADPAYTDAVTPAALARTRATFVAWDRIGVHACYGIPGAIPPTYVWDALPTTDGGVASLTMTYVAPDRWTLDPWPLTVPTLHLWGEGRLLRGPYPDRETLRDILDAAPWVRWESHITPPR